MRVVASQKLPRDSGETIFAARHQSVSQGPLGNYFQKGPILQISGTFEWGDQNRGTSFFVVQTNDAQMTQ